MSAIAIIPARKGSTRIPGKNTRKFFDKPIIEYSIETAKKSKLFDEIWVSTDDFSLATCGAKLHPRSPQLSMNEVGTQEVIQSVLQDLYPRALMKEPDYVCCIYATAPMLSSKTLQTAIEILECDALVDYVVPVASWLRDPGQFYFGKFSAFFTKEPLLSKFTVMLPIDRNTECDINVESDWQRAEVMYAWLNGIKTAFTPNINEILNERGNM